MIFITTVAPIHQFSHLWKHIVVFVLTTTIIGSLVVYIYAQRLYATIIEKDCQIHWNTVQELQQELIRLSEQKGSVDSPGVLNDERIKQYVSRIFQKAPQLFRISLLDTQGNLIWGKEAESVTEYFQTRSSSSPRMGSRFLTRSNDFPMLHEQVHSVQLPLTIHQQRVGFLRGEFFLIDSGTTLMKVAKVTLQIVIVAVGLMILSGVGLIFTQVVKHLAAKQHRLEEYVVSLEKANENLRRTRKELQVSEKLASLGYLAAGIAHEIGNPLGAVLGYVELLQKNSLARAKAQDILPRAEKELERIRRIIQELVNFSRPQAMNVQTVDINEIIRKLTSQFQVDPEKTVAIQLQLTEFPLLAEVDEHKLVSVFFNILRNSMDAIATAGRIQIATSRRIRESATMIGSSEVIAIRFSDNGSGIPEQYLAKVFEPFFTTKDPGKGMGLGLALCHRVIESLNGEIEIQSTYGQGTDVTVFLPPARKKEQK